MVSTTDTLCVERPAHAAASARNRSLWRVLFSLLVVLALAAPLMAQPQEAGGEANLKLPDLHSASFLGGISGHDLLLGGLAVSALGLVFGLIIFVRLRNMPVHASMREVSELIYE